MTPPGDTVTGSAAGLPAASAAIELALTNLARDPGEAESSLRRLAGTLVKNSPPAVGAAAARVLAAAAGDIAGAARELLTALAAAEPVTFLVIDDDPGIRLLLGEKLRAPGRTILEAEDPATARQLLSLHSVHLILLDLMLGATDGRNLLVQLKEEPATAAIPVLVISSRDTAAIKAECLALGAAGYLEKPFDFALLAATITAQLSAPSPAAASPLRDALTGADARSVLASAFTAAAAAPGAVPFCLALADIDNLATYNAAHGRPAGDAMLRRVAAVLSGTQPAPACVARWQGGMFACLFTATPLAAATAAVEAARRRLAEEQAGPGAITFSAGIAPVSASTLEDAVDDVARCLEQAKEHGRNRTVTPELCTLGQPHRVLLVEDDDLFAAIINHRLARENCTLERCADGRSAMTLLAEKTYDLVLLDVQLPALDGLQVLQQLRALPGQGRTPVMLITGLRSEEAVSRGLALGANDYLVKPFSPTEMVARVRRLLRPR